MRRRSPVIGVTGPDDRAWSLWAFNSLAVRRFGGRARFITPRRPVGVAAVDGLVVSGGADLDPALYGQPNRAARHVDAERDRLEADLLRGALEARKPILGICRGAQLLNVVCGGTLHQDAAEVYPGFRPTRGVYRRLTLRRPIHVLRDGWVASLLGRGRKPHLVNSLHHQAIDHVGDGLEVVAVDEQGMVQAIEGLDKSTFTVGVQWHPELMPFAHRQMAFFAALVKAVRKMFPPHVPPPGQ